MSTTEAPTYPIRQLFPTDGDDSYPELLPAIEFHNQRRYEVALKLFLERPADPGRALKNMICTFHGPIGWLLMFNTRVSAHHRHPLAASVGPEGAHEKSRRKWPTGIQRGAWPASPT